MAAKNNLVLRTEFKYNLQAFSYRHHFLFLRAAASWGGGNMGDRHQNNNQKKKESKLKNYLGLGRFYSLSNKP